MRQPAEATQRALALIGTLGADGKPISAYRAAKLTGVNLGTVYRHTGRLRRAALKPYEPTTQESDSLP